VQLGERLYGRTRGTKFHGRTRRGVKHPRRYNNYDTGRSFDVNHLAAGSLLAVLSSYTAPVQRVPAVEDLNFMRDMRRMTQ